MLHMRLQSALGALGLRVSDAKVLGVAERTLRTYLSGEGNPPTSFWLRLATVASERGRSINLDYLLMGATRAAVDLQLLQPDGTSKAYPMAGEWLASWGLTPDTAQFVAISGNAMEPSFSHGDFVLIDTRQTDARHPDIYGLVADGVTVVRQVEISGGNAQVTSLHPSSPARTYDAKKIQILGRVVLGVHFRPWARFD